MKRIHIQVFIFLMLAMVSQAQITSQIPQLINYQGLLTDSAGIPLADSTYSVTFRMHNEPSFGITLWSETQNVATTNGIFSVILGSISPISTDVFYDSVKYLGVSVEPFSELLPRTRLAATPYAYNSYRVSTIDGSSGGQVSGNIEIIPASTPDGKLEIQGTNFIGLYTNGTGDGSVVLPTGGVNSAESFNEPGIASIRWTGAAIELGTSMTSLCSLVITIPETGYIFLMGATRIDVGNDGVGNLVYVQIDETPGGSVDYANLAFQAGGSFTQVGSVSPQQIYLKAAGTYTFWLEAMKGSASTPCFCSRSVLTAMYFPTAYGFVGTTQ